MGNNPQHNQHIKEFMRYSHAAFEEMGWQMDIELKNIHDALSALDARVERIEAAVASSPAHTAKDKQEKKAIEADVYITKESLKKVRNAIMNMFK